MTPIMHTHKWNRFQATSDFLQSSSVVLCTSAFPTAILRAGGQQAVLPRIAAAGAAGVEIRRELRAFDSLPLEALGKAIQAEGLSCVSYSVPAELIAKGDSTLAPQLLEALEEADQLGATFLKYSLGHYSGKFDWAALANALEKHQARLLLENDQTLHGGSLEPLASFLADSRAAGVDVGTLFDIGNWLTTGENPATAAARLGEFVEFVHCKGVRREGEHFTSTPMETVPGWEELFRHFKPGLPRAIEFPLPESSVDQAAARYVEAFKAV
ncbi:MAG TPA: TIM barrel protein [Chthoniobacterales bacterium]